MSANQSTGTSEGQDSATSADLLVPRFDATKHQLYVDRLKALIDGRKARNIAVAGQYSTGKSSVLVGLTQALATTNLRPITLSLSTIDAKAARSRVGGEGVEGEDSASAGIPAITSLIQNEIVKQLVYRKRPSKVPDSRFRRTEAFSPLRSAGWSLAAAVVAFVVIKILPTVGPTTRGVLAAIAAAVALFLFLWRLRGRLTLQQFTAGPASLALDTSKSYFDEYLDELIYFFDVSRCRVVIFEDIDRFDDPHIFETLRELNTLLNSADQLADKKHGPIRFIYATRDSIFEIDNRAGTDSTPGGPGSPAADRTKFFDAVVPLVPFVTHRTSRDHFTRLLNNTAISPRVVRIVSKYVTDMRLIVNICNELQIFSAVVLHERGLRNLNVDNLFAMVVYKNLYPGDFEKITVAQSRLDKVRTLYRRTVNETADRMERHLAELRTSPTQSRTVEDYLATAAARLTDTIDDLVASHGGNGNPHIPPTIMVDGAQHQLDQLAQPEFWEAVARTANQVNIQIPGRHVPLPRTAIERAFGADLPESTVAEVLRRDVEDEIRELEHAHRALLEAGVADLFGRSDLIVDGEPLDFAQQAGSLVASSLTVELLQAGFIDAHFAFYVADYPAETMSPAAAEFEMTVIEQYASDPRFKLPQAASDVPALIESAGEAFLQDRRGYNIDIVDYLLEEESEHLDGLMTALAGGKDDDTAFIDAYLASGKHQRPFLHRLAGKWELIFYYLAQRTEPDVETERAWIDAALRGAAPDLDYRFSPVAAERLEEHAAAMPAFTDIGAANVPALIHVVSRLRAALPNISNFVTGVRSGIVGAGLYRVNGDNLRALAHTSSQHLPALDELTSVERGDLVVDHVLAHLSDYIKLLKNDPDARAVADASRFAEIVDRLGAVPTFAQLENEDACLLIGRAPDGARVDELSDVPTTTWPALVTTGRCRPSVSNLSTYLAEHGDHGDWPELLSHQPLSVSDDDTQETRQRVAVALLAMGTIDAGRRVELIHALDLESYIPVDQLPQAAIALLPELTEAAVTADAAEVLDAIPAAETAVRERFIATSTNLADYLDDLTLTDHDVAAVLDSGNQAAITKLLQRADQLQALSPHTASLAVEKAITATQPVPFDALLAIISCGPPAPRSAALLTKQTDDLDAAQLRQLLDAMPAPYSNLGLSEAELPEERRDLADALLQKGLVSRVQKVRNRPQIRVVP